MSTFDKFYFILLPNYQGLFRILFTSIIFLFMHLCEGSLTQCGALFSSCKEPDSYTCYKELTSILNDLKLCHSKIQRLDSGLQGFEKTISLLEEILLAENPSVSFYSVYSQELNLLVTESTHKTEVFNGKLTHDALVDRINTLSAFTLELGYDSPSEIRFRELIRLESLDGLISRLNSHCIQRSELVQLYSPKITKEVLSNIQLTTWANEVLLERESRRVSSSIANQACDEIGSSSTNFLPSAEIPQSTNTSTSLSPRTISTTFGPL